MPKFMAPPDSTGKSLKNWSKNGMVRYDSMKTFPDMKDRKFMKSEKSAESAK